jgi:hypothetical protein
MKEFAQTAVSPRTIGVPRIVRYDKELGASLYNKGHSRLNVPLMDETKTSGLATEL